LGYTIFLFEKVGINYQIYDVFPPYSDSTISKDQINIKKQVDDRIALDKSLENIQPFYLLDFSVLISIIENFWDNHISSIFIKQNNESKKLIVGRLNYIKPIRNDIAHNRTITQEQYNEIESCTQFVVEYIKPIFIKKTNILISKDKFDTLNIFITTLEDIKSLIDDFQVVKRDYLNRINDIYHVICMKINSIELMSFKTKFITLVKLISTYNRVPRKTDDIRAARKKRIDINLMEFINSVINDAKELKKNDSIKCY